MKKNILILLLLACSFMGHAQVNRPKLVVGIVVDQMRWDYLYYYNKEFVEGGFKRLLAEGYSCENTMIPYIPTVTAIGHSSIYTGSVPALTGILGNSFFINGKNTYCCGDDNVQSVGSSSKEGKMSPRNLLASTIGDELKLATNFKSKVIGVALKDRAAILPAGHSADAAYWWDTSAGHFVTSTYYMDKLPSWAVDFNKKHQQKPGSDIKSKPQGVTMTFDMAEAALKNERLGLGTETDMLAVSVSSTDIIGHMYSTRGPEIHDAYIQLDRDLAHFFNTLDAQVGRGNYLVFLTADHGGSHNPNFMRSHKLAAGGFAGWDLTKEINKELQQSFGTKNNFILGENALRIYFDRKSIAEAGLELAKVKAKAKQLLEKKENITYVVDYDNVATQPIAQPIRERIINGYSRERGGDLLIITNPGWVNCPSSADYKGTNHGLWNPDDSHIPLIFMGWGITPGATSHPTSMTDIAPSVCSMLHIQMPNACVGNPVF
ncbi:alkaline phosphatase family protein [Segatella oris]|uniref:alkaline phosphatase family protein n=1 Tax=Segatella oris TaxID=28135 RepID=UPI0028EA5E46|nr:alkaline phosphatase family protein [Segatella oris]